MVPIGIAKPISLIVCLFFILASSRMDSPEHERTIRVISEIVPTETAGQASPAATLAGAITEGVIGNLLGTEENKRATTVYGALVGAVAAAELNRQQNNQRIYCVLVEMPEGYQRSLHLASIEGFQKGDSVRVNTNRLVPI